MANEAQWDRIWELFEAALDVPPGERTAWLRRATDDPEIAVEVTELLAAHVRDTGVLDRPPEPGSEPAGKTALRRSQTATPDAEPYRILKEIGRGGMGVVYLAEDPRLDRRVALKFLSSRLSGDPSARRRLLREARAASKLDHPNICTVYDVGEASDGRPFVAMAYYEGPTVGEMIAAGPLPYPQAVEIIVQAAQGLARAHAEGVIHRDIKPSNLLVDEGRTVRILDFGVAKLVGSTATDSGVRLGTPLYMAPEQIIGKGVGPRSDLWALGVVLYEMIAGERPFAADRELTAIYEILNEDPEPASKKATVPPELDAVLLKLLQKKPEDRYATAEDLVSDLAPLGLPAGAVTPNNLPSERSRLIGRDREIEAVSSLLVEGRLVTLLGPGGAGKTRLALAVSRRQLRDRTDGVYFVDLAPLSEPSLAPAAIAAAVGRTDPTTPPLEGLKSWIGERRVLLALDNFEHIPDAADAVAELLAACPHLRILATSRTPLHVMGEHEYPVEPLPAPESESSLEALARAPAVELFLERAREAKPSFELTDANAEAVRAICLRLDGLPLAIELAAARIRLFPPAALLEKLLASADVLEGKERDRPERHRTLRQAVAWSYELLSAPARRLFRRLGVFSGGASLPAVESVCARDSAEAFAALDELVEHSLVQRGEAGGEPRFRMLETIREHALRQLAAAGEQDEAHDAHGRFFLHFAERAAPQLTGPEQKTWLDRLHADHANLRSAAARAIDARDAATALRFLAALWRFWIIRENVDEALERCRQVFALPVEQCDPALRANALHGYATVAHYRGENDRARDLADRSVEVWRRIGDAGGLATALTNRAWVSCEMSEFAKGHALSVEALALHQTNGDLRGAALACNNLGFIAAYRGRTQEALEWHERGLSLRDRVGDRRGRAFVLPSLAWAHRLRGDFDRAHALIDEAVEILEEIVDPTLRAWALTQRAQVILDQGLWAEAAAAAREAHQSWELAKNRIGLAWCEMIAAESRRRIGRAAEAETDLLRILGDCRRNGFRYGAAVVQRLLALVLAARGEHRESRRLLNESLAACREFDDRLGVSEALEVFAQIESDRKSALAALAAAERLRAELEAPAPPATRADIDRQTQEFRLRAGAHQFKKEWAAAAQTPLDEVLAAVGKRLS